MSWAVRNARLVCTSISSSCPARLCEGWAAVAFEELELDELDELELVVNEIWDCRSCAFWFAR